MSLYRKGLITLAVLAAAAMVHISLYYSALPEIVPTKFGLDGHVTSTMTRGAFAMTYMEIIALLFAVFTGLTLLLPRLPVSMINLPNKEYWLAPERREDTTFFLASWLAWMGAATVLFVMVVTQVTIMFQLGQIKHVNGLFLPLIGGYIVMIIAGMVAMLRKFFLPVNS